MYANPFLYCFLPWLLSQSRAGGADEGLFPEDMVLCWFVQLLLALHHLHNRHILHRDLKPENVLLSKNLRVVKLADFGVSKQLDAGVGLAVTCLGECCKRVCLAFDSCWVRWSQNTEYPCSKLSLRKGPHCHSCACLGAPGLAAFAKKARSPVSSKAFVYIIEV